MQIYSCNSIPVNFGLQAYNLLQELRSKSSMNPSYFISMSTLEAIHKHLNIPLTRGGGSDKNGMAINHDEDDIQGEAIEEEVIDDFD